MWGAQKREPPYLPWQRIPAGLAVRALLSAVLLIAAARQPAAAVPGPQSEAAQVHLDHGLELARAGELAAAEEELRTAVRLAPNRADCLSGLATVLAIEKKFEESTTLF